MPRRSIPAPSASAARPFGASDETALPVLSRQIRFLREKGGLEQKELARRIGVTSNAVSNWECGRGRPDLNLLPALASALGATLYDLFGLETPSFRLLPGERELLSRYRELTDGHKTAVDRLAQTLLEAQTPQEAPALRRLLYFGRPLSAGPGDPTEIDGRGVPIYLRDSETVRRADCVFPVNGDSMEPRYHSGDLVLVSRIPDAPPLRFGEVGAFIAGNETYIKICREDGLYSFNPAFAPLRFDESTPVFLIGRVLGTLDRQLIAAGPDGAFLPQQDRF